MDTRFSEPATFALPLIENRWSVTVAAHFGPEQELLYRSNLLGADIGVTNFGGGNTSAKLRSVDPVTDKEVDILWVKGSGADMRTMTLDGFATLYMEKLLTLPRLYLGPQDEDRMVSLYSHCAFNLNPRVPSIDTPLHALIAHKHVDHVHPDAVIAIAASIDSQALTEQIYGADIGWLPWIRPGFELGLQLRRFTEENPSARGAMLQSHGLITWGETAVECYANTIGVINKAVDWLETHGASNRKLEAGHVAPLSKERRREFAAVVMPRVRGLISGLTPKVGHFDDSVAVLDFVGSEALSRLAALGTSCPDHFLRTKIRPLVLPFDPVSETEQEFLGRLPAAIETYRTDYAAYYARCKRPSSPSIRDASPVVYLIPGVGMLTFARDKLAARIAGQFYINAINVIRASSNVSTYSGLPEQEAFDIEYWPLEEAKLQLLPKPKALAGRIALVTGGAGGIGLATARRLMTDGACVVLCDIDENALNQAEQVLDTEFGSDFSVGWLADVTDEAAITALFRDTVCEFGGLDICVSNAGIASAAPIEDTSIALWQRNMDILATGYFLVSRQTVRLLRSQNIGGSIVFIGSKNALVASSGASAYCTAKAAELHLARCLALECAPAGIRVNVVNPDAVLRGSKIWDGEWAAQRAQQNNATTNDLNAIYRERSLLKRSVYPEDVAEAVAYFASERSAKSTGNILNVDAGNAAAFTR